jgi:hypothetical protein
MCTAIRKGDVNLSDNTGRKQARDRLFRPGQSGNWAGRPKGSRNKLSEIFLKALADDFEAHGKGVVEKVRAERPHDYAPACAEEVWLCKAEGAESQPFEITISGAEVVDRSRHTVSDLHERTVIDDGNTLVFYHPRRRT